MGRRIAVYGATDAALALLPALARRRDLALAWLYDPDARALRRRLAWIEPGAARLLQQALTDDPRVPAAPAPDLLLVIDGGLARAPVAPPAGALSPAIASARLALAPAPWREPSAPARLPREPEAIALPSALSAAIAAGRRFALLRCDVGPAAGAPPALVARVRRRAAEALRDALAPGERLATDRDGALVALVPLEARADAGARVVSLARDAAEHVANDLGEAPLRTPLVFGYAVHPDEERSADGLLRRAAQARIRML